MDKAPDAFRTISEVSEWLDTPTYVLRFWESRFPQIKPVKRAGGRRYYRPEDMMLLGGIKKLLHFEDKTIKSVKKLLKDKGVKHVMDLSPDLDTQVVSPQSKGDDAEKAAIAEMVKATDESRKAKPKVEVRVVKKGKLAEQPEAEDAVAAKADSGTDGQDKEPVVAEEAVADDPAANEDAPETVAQDAVTEDIVAQRDDEEAAGADVKDAVSEAEDEVAEAEPAVAQPNKKSKKKAKADKKAAQEPVDAMAMAKAEEADRQEAAKAAAAAKTIADEEAEDWGELEADIVRNIPYALKPASAYDADTMHKIETLYYSLRMVRNSMKRAKDREEDTAA